MQRTILAAPDISAGLAELKDWLAVTTPRDDAVLAVLLHAALDTCEGFTGALPLLSECEEILPASGEWQGLSTRPVAAITALEAIPAEGPRQLFAPDAYALEIEADGTGRFRLLRQGHAGRVAVYFMAGLAREWNLLPDALRHGAIRLAAHHYRARAEGETGSSPPAAPPSAIAALWRPFRRVRLA